MNLFDYVKKDAVSRAYKYGLVLTPEALEYVVNHVSDMDSLFRRLKSQGIHIVRVEDIVGEEIEEGVKKEADSKTEQPDLEDLSTRRLDERKHCDNRIRVLMYVDPDELEPASWERELRRILLERLEFLSGEISSIHRVSFSEYERAVRSDEERHVVGIVFKLEIKGSGKPLIYIENQESSAKVIFSGRDVSWKLNYVDQDSVVAFTVIGSEDRLVAKDVLFPFSKPLPIAPTCTYKLLVVPEPYRWDLLAFKDVADEVDGILLLSNIVNVYKDSNIKKRYGRVDEFISSLDMDVYVVPGMYDITRTVPPHPPIEDSLMPNSASSDHVHLLGSPALVKIGQASVLMYDGEYYVHTGRPAETIVYTRLVQPNISSYPYRSTRDYSLLRRAPNVVLLPVGGGIQKIGDSVVMGERMPYVLEIYSGKVVWIWGEKRK